MGKPTFPQMEEFFAQVKAGRITDEIFQKFLLTPNGSDWQSLFGHLWICNSDFNESNFPLGADPGDEAEEFGFDRLVTGHGAIREFERIKRRPASLWAQSRYTKTNPGAQKVHTLVGIGARWLDRHGDVWLPVFDWSDDKPKVVLGLLADNVAPRCRFLLSKEKKG